MQNIRIYQAANNSTVLKRPLYSHERDENDQHYPWLQPGYYFWEHHIEDAMAWGQIRYDGNYSIYSCSYNMDDQTCLDLVSNYRHREFFFHVRERLIKKNKGDVSIEKIIKWLLDNQKESTRFDCVRLLSKTFYGNRKEIQVPTPNGQTIKFCQTTVQVCFYEFPNELITEDFIFVESYSKESIYG